MNLTTLYQSFVLSELLITPLGVEVVDLVLARQRTLIDAVICTPTF
jgi:hypothetical protein